MEVVSLRCGQLYMEDTSGPQNCALLVCARKPSSPFFNVQGPQHEQRPWVDYFLLNMVTVGCSAHWTKIYCLGNLRLTCLDAIYRAMTL